MPAPRSLLLPLLLLLAPPALGQPATPADPSAEALPEPTEAGLADLRRLVARCIEGEALDFLPRTEDGPSRLVLVDSAALDRILREDPAAITPALRDALLTTGQLLDQSVLLEAIAGLEGDPRLLAYAALARGESLEREGDAPAASRRYEEAARRFEALGYRGRQALAMSSLADLLARQGRADEARALHGRILALAAEHWGADSREAAIARLNLGAFEEDRGRPRDALDAFRRAAEALGRLPDPDPADLISAHQNVGGVLLDIGEQEAALDAFRRSLEWAGRLPEGQGRTAGIARAEANLALAEQRTGQPDEARARYRRAIAALEGLAAGRPDPMLAEVLDRLGTLELEAGDREACLANIERAQQMRLALHGDRSWSVVDGYLQVGAARGHFGDYPGARDAYGEATRVAELLGGPRHPAVAEGLAAQAEVALDQGDDRHAIGLIEREWSIRSTVDDRPDALAGCRNRLGKAYHRLGDDGRAAEEFRAAIGLWTRAGPSHAAGLAASWQNLGLALAGLGHHAEAIGALETAAAIRERATPDDVEENAAGLNALGSLLYDRGDYAGALREHQRAWDLLSGRPATTALLRASTHYNLGMARFGLRQWPEAAARFDEALEALRARPAEPDPAPDSARVLYGFAPEDLLPVRLTAMVLQLRGMTRLRMAGNPPSSRDLLDASYSFVAALSVLERLRRFEARDEGRWELARDLGNLDALLIGCYARLRGRPDAGPRERADSDELIVKAADLGAARSLLIELAEERADVLGGLPPAVRGRRQRLLDELREVEAALARVQSPGGLDRDFAAVEALTARRARAERALVDWRAEVARDNPDFARWEQPRPASPAEVREALADDEVMLIYIVGDAESHLVLIEAGPGPIEVATLPRSGELAELIAAALDPSRLASRRVAPAWREAYRVLIGPVARRIEGKALVIVPTGPLGQLPFGLIVRDDEGGGRGRFLAQEHRIRYAPSPGVLRLIRRWEERRDRPDRLFWGVGDPVYSPDDTRLPAEARGGRPVDGNGDGDPPARLAESGRELEAIREALGDPSAVVLLGPEAVEEAVKAASGSGGLARHRYVHLAVHGLLGSAADRRPRLLLGLGGGGGEDGSLGIDEVAALRLNADLTVLSACESGLGRLYEGEGVRGLAQAFLQAGSRGVVCSFWRVADAPTAGLMTGLYARLRSGATAAEALHDAQLAAIEAGDPPLFWAPFVLIGE